MYTITPTSRREFLSLTDRKTGEPVYLDVSQIASIQQIPGDDTHPRHTRIFSGGLMFMVTEEAAQIALCSGRGYYGPKDYPGVAKD
jgi:hypothetical protein